MRSYYIVAFIAACLLAGAEAVKTKQSMWWIDEEGNEVPASDLEAQMNDWWTSEEDEDALMLGSDDESEAVA
jgi:hypothetical protein